MKKISVVVPCYNAADCLHHCMDHLVGQTIGIDNIEIILVDDASTDNGATWQVIMQYENQYPESVIAISLEENLRQGGARNVGISYASGEYLVFCDSDDWLRVEALELLYSIIKHENADVVEYRYKKVYTYEEADSPIKYGDASCEIIMDNEEKRRKQILVSTDELTLGCMNKIYRLSLVRDHEIKFAERLIYEEPSFMLPVRLYTTKHIFIDVVLYYYYQNPVGTMHGDQVGGARRLDNANVWIGLYEDLQARGLIDRFPAELQYMFWSWGVGLSVNAILHKKQMLKAGELFFLKEMTLKYCPDIRKNTYITKLAPEWNEILLNILTMEFTQDNILLLNAGLMQYLLDNM